MLLTVIAPENTMPPTLFRGIHSQLGVGSSRTSEVLGEGSFGTASTTGYSIHSSPGFPLTTLKIFWQHQVFALRTEKKSQVSELWILAAKCKYFYGKIWSYKIEIDTKIDEKHFQEFLRSVEVFLSCVKLGELGKRALEHEFRKLVVFKCYFFDKIQTFRTEKHFQEFLRSVEESEF